MIRGALILGLTVHPAACGKDFPSADLALDLVEGVTESQGSLQITSDKELIGERLCATDACMGRYLSDCDGNTGKDVVFGEVSMESRKLYLSGCIITYSGQVVIRIQMNDEVIELEPDEDGYFESELSLQSGGNYVVVRYADFTGTVDLAAVYAPLSGLRA